MVTTRYTSPYSIWKDDYRAQVSEFVGNTQAMSENSYKTWFFTWKGFDGKPAAEVILDDFIKDNVKLKGGVPGKVDDPKTSVNEADLQFEWDGNIMTYLGALEEMKELKYNTPESRQKGIDLYLGEIKTQHDRLHTQYVASQTKKPNTGTGTGVGRGVGEDATNWFTPGTYVNIGGAQKGDRKSISAEKAEVLTNQLIEKGEGTITYEGVTYQWIPDYNVFAGDDGAVYGNIDDFLSNIEPWSQPFLLCQKFNR